MGRPKGPNDMNGAGLGLSAPVSRRGPFAAGHKLDGTACKVDMSSMESSGTSFDFGKRDGS